MEATESQSRSAITAMQIVIEHFVEILPCFELSSRPIQCGEFIIYHVTMVAMT